MPLKRIVLAVLDRTLTVLRLSVFFSKPVQKRKFPNRFTEVRRSKFVRFRTGRAAYLKRVRKVVMRL